MSALGGDGVAGWFPPARLCLRTPHLELRLPRDAEVAALAAVAAGGVHGEEMPFQFPWTVGAPEAVALRCVQWTWRVLGEATTESWSLPFTVFRSGEPVGCQRLSASAFAVSRAVETGSWLGLGFQGQGLGTLMRVAVLDLAFALGAQTANSAFLAGNDASAAVSAKLGYEPNGTEVSVVAGRRRHRQRLLMTRERWLAGRDAFPPVEVHGLDGDVRTFLGADGPAPD